MNAAWLSRRRLLSTGAATLVCSALGSAARAQAARTAIRVASNQGVENATLQQLMSERGMANSLDLELRLIESRSVAGPMEALLSGAADVCMISAFAGVLPAIGRGAPLRLIGAAQRLPALALYSADPGIVRVADLLGRRVGVGPRNGLLHIVMLALLRKRRIDPAGFEFVDSGSNAEVLEAVASGRVDAGLSGIAGQAHGGALRMLDDGRLWRELPEYTYQLSYASLEALQNRPESVARCLAAYTRMYRFVSTRGSRAAYLAARRRAAPDRPAAEALAVWNFVQHTQPYGREPGITPQRIAYLQELNVALGLQSDVLAYEQVVEVAPARAAARLLA